MLSTLPSSCLGGWCCLPFSLSLLLYRAVLHAPLPSTFFFSILLPSCPPPPPLLCSQSHFEVHICMHSYILPSCTLMHSNAQGGEMWKEGRGWVCVSTCTAVHAWKNWAVYVGHSRVLPSCLVTWETDFKEWDKETPLPSLLQTPQPFSQQFCVTGGHSV